MVRRFSTLARVAAVAEISIVLAVIGSALSGAAPSAIAHSAYCDASPTGMNRWGQCTAISPSMPGATRRAELPEDRDDVQTSSEAWTPS